MVATATTVTGSGTPTSLLVSTAANIPLPQDTSTSLFQAANATVTASGHTCVMIGRTVADLPLYVNVDISVDGTSVYNDHAGQQIVVKLPMITGSHTITFTAYAFNKPCNISVAGLMILDLGM